MQPSVGLALLVFAIGCVHSRPADKDLFAVPVISDEEMDTKRFRRLVSEAEVGNEPWVKDALQVAMRFIGPFEGRQQFVMREVANAECADKTTVLVIEDGYLDDSIRGSRYQVILEKDMRGVWYVVSARKAWRCWPDRGHGEFSTEPCR